MSHRNMVRAGCRLAVSSLLLAVSFAGTPARATCGSSTCFLVTGTEEGTSSAGSLRVDLSFRHVDQSRKLDGTHRVDEVLTPKVNFEERLLEPDHHREIRTENSLVQLDLAYGATERLTLLSTLPLIVDKAHEHFDEPGTPDEHFTNSDGTRGFGDVSIGARYLVLVKPNDLLLGGVSFKLPTGDYRLRDSEGAINEPTIQPGTGSYDLLGSIYYSHHFIASPFEWFALGSYRLDSENDLDYRIGNEAVVSGGIQHGSGVRFGWSLQVNARHTTRDRYRGERVPSTGADQINLTPGVSFRAESGPTFYGHLQIPVYQDVNEAQLAPRLGFIVGVSKTF